MTTRVSLLDQKCSDPLVCAPCDDQGRANNLRVTGLARLATATNQEYYRYLGLIDDTSLEYHTSVHWNLSIGN